MNTYEQIEYYGRTRKNWSSVGTDGFYERERRTRVIDKNVHKAVKGYAEIDALYSNKELISLEIIEHKNKKFGIYGEKLFKTIANKPSNQRAYSKLIFKRRYCRD